MKLPYTAILALMQAVVTTIYKATHELKEHFIQYRSREVGIEMYANYLDMYCK